MLKQKKKRRLLDLISLCHLSAPFIWKGDASQQLPLNSHLCHFCSRLLVQESWTVFRNSVESGDYWSMVRLG